MNVILNSLLPFRSIYCFTTSGQLYLLTLKFYLEVDYWLSHLESHGFSFMASSFVSGQWFVWLVHAEVG